jgi:hypothetical protein
MIQQTIEESYRKNQCIACFKPKSKQLTMIELAITEYSPIQPNTTQITVFKPTAREIKIGEIGPAKINMRENTLLIFTHRQRGFRQQ